MAVKLITFNCNKQIASVHCPRIDTNRRKMNRMAIINNFAAKTTSQILQIKRFNHETPRDQYFYLLAQKARPADH